MQKTVLTAGAGHQGASARLDDMSITLLAGRVPSSRPALEQAVEAERLGFRRIWVPERYNIKEAGTLLGGIGAVTTNVEVGPGPLSISSRPPIVTAAMAATFQSLYGPRFTLGVGRSIGAWLKGHGFSQVNYKTLTDWVAILKQLWRGETVDYEGPAGSYHDLTMIDRPDEAPPPVVFFHLGGPKASEVAADPVWDAIAFCNLTTPEVVHRSIQQTRAAVEADGRDPDSLYFIAPVTTAPDLSEDETLGMVAARVAIYLQLPVGEAIRKLNGWDEGKANEIRNHPMFNSVGGGLVDHKFHRGDVLAAARTVPDEWVRDAAAVGTAEEAARSLRRYRDAGAHEVDLYGSTPAENAGLVEAWRRQSPVNPVAQ